MFNAHLDSEAAPGPDYPYIIGVPNANDVGAWRDGDRIFGHTVLNDRGCMAVFMIAAKAIAASGVRPRGDIYFVSAAGETGAVPVDEFQGYRYQGKGLGTSYLLEHGFRTDYAVIAESTSNAITSYNCGVSFYRVAVRGKLMYTPRMLRTDDIRTHPNAVVKGARAVTAIEDWAVEFERRRTFTHSSGTVVRPKAQVTGIRGNIPWRMTRSAPSCLIYMDVRTLPDEDPLAIKEEIANAVSSAGVDCEVDLLLTRNGVEARNAGPLIDAVETSHKDVKQEATSQPSSEDLSMYRDAIPLNHAGIPAISFGPSRGDAAVQGTGSFELSDLIESAKIYALTALRVTGTID
jgi:acetylornithine deacetylase/succinyl-diaminopimelate desuccinylase-like protein